MTSKWIYKVKHVANGSVENFKAHFVEHRFSQVKGVDYDETFVLVAIFSSIGAVIFVMVEMGWKIHQMDVETTFLNGLLQEEMYLE